MKQYALMFILILSGVFALSGGFESCWIPNYDNAYGTYELFTDYLETNTSDYGTISIDYADLGAEAWGTRMNATGLEFLDGAQFQDASLNRGAFVLARDNTTGFYSAWFQWNDDVEQVGGLIKEVNGSDTRYCKNVMDGSSTSYEGACVWASYDGTNAGYLIHGGYMNGGQAYCQAYKPFNESAYCCMKDSGGVPYYNCDNDIVGGSATTQGENVSINVEASFGDTVRHVGSDGNAGQSTSYHLFLNQSPQGQLFEWFDDFGCGDNTGDVTFFAYEGSEECDIKHTIDQFNCTILSDSCEISAGSNNTYAVNATEPIFVDQESDLTSKDGVNYWLINPYHDIANDIYESDIYLYKASTHTSALTIKPYNKDTPFVIEFLGGTYTIPDLDPHSLTDQSRAWITRYAPPSGSLSMIDVDTLYFDTIPVIANPCGTGDSYYINFVVGLNTTHYKRSYVSCIAGVATASYTNTTDDLEDLIITDGFYSKINYENHSLENFETPVWTDATSGTINRFMAFEYDEVLGDVNEGEVFLVDNENFLLQYNATNYTLQYCVIEDLTKGRYYSYTCNIPSGYTGEASGDFYLENSSQTIIVDLQQEGNINANVTVYKQGSPIRDATCVSNAGASISDAYGTCQFFNLTEYNDLTVTITHGNDRKTITLPIDDVYNSERYGDGDYCVFNPTYQFTVHFDKDFVDIPAWAIERSTGWKIEGVNIYLDGDLAVITDEQGLGWIEVDWDYQDHNVTMNKTLWSEYETTVRHTDTYLEGKLNKLNESASYGDSVDVDKWGTSMLGDYSEIADYLLSPWALMFFAVMIGILMAYMFTQSFGIAMVIGLIIVIAGVMFGALPEWVGIIMAIAITAIVALTLKSLII